jgi:hypothetical protein
VRHRRSAGPTRCGAATSRTRNRTISTGADCDPAAPAPPPAPQVAHGC